jgi:hypothetical protein
MRCQEADMGEIFSTIASWVSELTGSMLHSTPQGFVGVGLIFFYFVVMLGGVALRIKRGDHMKAH